MYKILIAFVLLCLGSTSHATTYYTRADGTALKAAALGPASDTTKCMSPAAAFSATYTAGSTIVVSSRGGDISAVLTVLNSGSAGNPIVFQGESGHIPVLDCQATACVSISQKHHVELNDFIVKGATTSGVSIAGNSANNVILRRIRVENSGGRGFYIRDAASATFYDVEGIDNTTSGFLAEGSSVTVIHGAQFNSNGVGISLTAAANLTAYNIGLLTNTTAAYSQSADTGGLAAVLDGVAADNVILAEAGALSITRARLVAGFAGPAIDTGPALTRGNLTLTYSVIKGMAADQYAVACRDTSICALYNNDIVGAAGVGSGLLLAGTGYVKNNIVVRCAEAINTSGGFVLEASHNCLFENTTDFGGSGGSQTNGVVTSPQFVAIDSGDYTLRQTSPCRNAGTNLSLESDLIHRLLPVEGVVDIGALEYRPRALNGISFGLKF